MKRTLRYLFLSLMAVMATSAYAQKQVTLDFDNDYQKLFPTLKGTSSGSNETYVGDGDFTGTTESESVDGVSVVIMPEENAKTPSRIWSSSPRLRMYSGSFIIKSGEGKISKVEFTAHSKNFNITAATGQLDGTVWTGSSDNAVTFNVEKNTQISTIVVTLDDGSQPGDDGDDDDDDFEFTWGQVTDNGDQVVFDFRATYKGGDEFTGQMVFGFANGLCNSGSMTANFPTEELAQTVYEQALKEASEEGYSSVTKDGKTVTIAYGGEFMGQPKAFIVAFLNEFVDMEGGFTGEGTLENPFSATEAIIVTSLLEADKSTDENVYIKGKIASVKYTFNANYGTATFFISDDGKDENTFQVYSCYYLENKPWVEGNTQIQVGDEVIVCGKLVNYKGNTPETVSKQAYIYSLNGKTKNESSENPVPDVETVDIATALGIIGSLDDGKTTSKEYCVKGIVTSIQEVSTNYGNATFNLADNATDGAEKQITVFRAKGFDNEKIADENIIKVGDEVYVRGKLQKYVKNGAVTPEVSSCYIVLVNGKGVSSVNAINVEADHNGVVYNLKGQQVDQNYRGIVIKNGKKVLKK